MKAQSPKAFIFMRVGHHAGEELDTILARKQRELRAAGQIFWGYGGPTLHPTKAVQPFVKLWEADEGAMRVLMATTDSRADRNIFSAREFSIDGNIWKPLPSSAVVTGAKYALVLGEIEPVTLNLDLRRFEVGIGRSRGRNAASYIRGRVDKGCLVATQQPDAERVRRQVSIALQARLLAPYAVMVR